MDQADQDSRHLPADAAAEERAMARGEADLASGRSVPHEDVVKWLRSWGKPHELPPPTPRTWR